MLRRMMSCQQENLLWVVLLRLVIAHQKVAMLERMKQLQCCLLLQQIQTALVALITIKMLRLQTIKKKSVSRKKISKKKTVVEMLGRELECTLSEYQTSFDLSSSNERVHHLKKMNKLVSNIAKVHWGMECPNSNHAIGDSEMKGWSFKKSQRRSSDKEKQEKKKHRSKKDKKKKRRRHGKEKKGKEFQNSEGPHDQVLESSMLW
mmetsp:Transcript_42380/g.72373  ORF Transcript_42380/g.72373 Transcript_42380/m.72373 type:complete len:205 (+) Transcript_42380:1453-2067(+)